MYHQDTLARVTASRGAVGARMEAMAASYCEVLEKDDLKADIYGNAALVCLLLGVHTEAALAQIKRTAQWFELPHPTGRDPRGESTFAAMSLVCILYRAAERLTPEVRQAVDHFFLRHDFTSMYESENHRLQHHTALYLAANFYRESRFEWCGKRGAMLIDEEEAYLLDFLRFRAKRSWGEFDSCGYLAVDFTCLLDLHDFSPNDTLRSLSRMMMDVLLLDMAVDSVDGLYGGAHGRIYPPSALNAAVGGMQNIYYLYFGHPYGEWAGMAVNRCLLSDYRPSEIAYQVALGHAGAYINREGKHLHCIPAAQQPGTISKYTYVTPRYIIGAVNRQDDYREGTEQRWYAHHEQHELDALIIGDPRAKVFTHHPGDFKEHNQWTGDLRCCCVETFCDLDVAMSVYNIAQDRFPYINAHFHRGVLSGVTQRGNWVFGEHKGVYAALYGSGGWRWAQGESAEYELLSDGLRHGCVIELSCKEASLEAFIGRILKNPLSFDPQTLTLTYTSSGRERTMQGKARAVNGQAVGFPYETFDSPYVQAKAGEAQIRVNGMDRRAVYDFERAAVAEEMIL